MEVLRQGEAYCHHLLEKQSGKLSTAMEQKVLRSVLVLILLLLLMCHLWGVLSLGLHILIR